MGQAGFVCPHPWCQGNEKTTCRVSSTWLALCPLCGFEQPKDLHLGIAWMTPEVQVVLT